jgi:thymidylate kinase
MSPKQVKAQIARSLIAALTSECKSYCLLSGYERLPDSFDTDIDFMVDEEDFGRTPRIIQHVAQETNSRLFHTVEHEITARSYSLGFQSGQELTIVQPDSTSDYRHFGSLWLRATEVLRARRLHPRGFWIPSAAHEFTYYLIKRLNKKYLNEEHGLKLHRLYLDDSIGCDQMIARYWNSRLGSALSRMAATNDWAEMSLALEAFRAELKRNTEESLWERMLFSPRHALHHIRRTLRPTGGWIAIMGPDGAGKSAVIEVLRQQFKFAYREVRCFHLRPKSLRSRGQSAAEVTDPHGKPARGLLASIAKVFYLIADYWLGYVSRIAPGMRRSNLIIFDRYIYDLLVDWKRVRYGGPMWLLRWAARVVPRPNLVILLDAPADVLWSRKREVPFEEVVRQREGYLEVARGLGSAVVVDAAQSLAGVIHDVDCAVVEYFERRAAGRLELQIPMSVTNRVEVQTPVKRC